MTLDAFRQLSLLQQLLHLFAEGTFLAQRWENEGGVNLYYCVDEGRGFFVEVGYEEQLHCATILRSFASAEPLEDYIHGLPSPVDK